MHVSLAFRDGGKCLLFSRLYVYKYIPQLIKLFTPAETRCVVRFAFEQFVNSDFCINRYRSQSN